MDQNCSICTDHLLSPSEFISACSCGHVYHERCLQTWIKTSRTCPTCRLRQGKHGVRRIYLNVIPQHGHSSQNQPSTSDARHGEGNGTAARTRGTVSTSVSLYSRDVVQENARLRTQNRALKSRCLDLQKQRRAYQALLSRLTYEASQLRERVDQLSARVLDHLSEVEWADARKRRLEEELTRRETELARLSRSISMGRLSGFGSSIWNVPALPEGAALLPSGRFESIEMPEEVGSPTIEAPAASPSQLTDTTDSPVRLCRKRTFSRALLSSSPGEVSFQQSLSLPFWPVETRNIIDASVDVVEFL